MALVTYNNTLIEWENIIRVQLKVVNPSLLKSGALGILANYLAGIKYDALQFYSKTFQEMNVGLAQDFNSMLYHSTIYGTEIEFASPSTLSSSIVVPEITITGTDSVIYTIPRYTPFVDTNGVPFRYISEITMEITGDSLYASAWNPEVGTKKLTITKAPNPNVPGSNVFLVHNSDAQQFERTFSFYDVPSYDVGETFTFNIGIEDITTLKEVNVWINTNTLAPLTTQQKQQLESMDPDDIEGAFSDELNSNGQAPVIEVLNIKYYKFDSSLRDQDIFIEIYESSLAFETGNGVNGAILPPGEIIVDLQTTMGSQGNMPNSEYLLTDVVISDGQGIVDAYTTSLNGLSATGSYGGKNIQQADGIRENIFDQITVRDSIITENDYERLFKYQDIKPFVDAKFLDAKAFVFLFNVIHDNDQVVHTTSVNYKEEYLVEEPFYPLYNYGGIDLISPFYYKQNSSNVVDAYIVDPSIPFSLSYVSIDPANPTENISSSDYRADIALTYEFERSQTGISGKSYFEILAGANDDYEYHVYASWMGTGGHMILNSSNEFKEEISTLYTDPFCIVREETTSIKVDVYRVDGYNKTLEAKFEDTDTYHQLILKQSFYKYFQELPEGETVSGATSMDTVGYLDNYLSDIMSTSTDVYELNNEYQTETYLLRLPFIDEEWFLGKPKDEIFEIMDSYFIADYLDEEINYNTQLTQAFHNTIDIPAKYYPYLFEENTNAQTDDPQFQLSMEVFVDRDAFLTSKYTTITDLEIAIKISAINFMKEKEGFMIDYYETDLEKALYNEFSPLIKNVRVTSPTLFMVNNSSTIYNSIQENLDFQDALDFIPPYFYYSYDDMNLEITM